MSKILFSLPILLLFFSSAFSQKVHYIELQNEEIQIPQRNFYIAKVIDERYSKDNLGWIRKGMLNSRIPVDFEHSLEFALLEYFSKALPEKDGQAPITLVFKVLKSSEEPNSKVPAAYADVRVEFHHNNSQLFWTDEHVENSGSDIDVLLEQSLREVLSKSIESFSESDWKVKYKAQNPENVIDNKFENPDYAYFVTEKEDTARSGPITYDEDELKDMVPRSRDVFVLGFGIGGLSLIGVNYEARLTNLLGIHGGVGYLATDFFGESYFSYTAGIKIHTGPTKNHSFINLSYKDAGFGLLGVAAIEYGDRVVFSEKKDFGLVWQVGLGVITNVDNEINSFYGDSTYLYILTGVGLSFNLAR